MIILKSMELALSCAVWQNRFALQLKSTEGVEIVANLLNRLLKMLGFFQLPFLFHSLVYRKYAQSTILPFAGSEKGPNVNKSIGNFLLFISC